jgi:hypothetical protein
VFFDEPYDGVANRDGARGVIDPNGMSEADRFGGVHD